MTVQQPLPVQHPSVWTATQQNCKPEEWCYTLSLTDLAEIDAALQHVQAKGLALMNVTQADFSLPTLGPRLKQFTTDVVDGRGFQIIKGLPVHRYTAAESTTVYWGLGTYWGKVVPQNKKAHLIGHVRDIHKGDGLKNPLNRVYSTNAAEPWHVDDADVVGLLCLHTAKEGGLTSWSSSGAIYNRLLESHPDYVKVLSMDCYLDRKNEIPAGKKPYFVLPVFTRYKGNLCCFYADNYYQLCQRHEEVPRLTPTQLAAFAEFNRLAALDELRMDMKLQPGDIQLLHNHSIVHCRSGFIDYEEEERKRHLLRMWITPEQGWPLPEQFSDRYHTIEIGNRGGIYCPNETPYVPLDPYQ